MIQVKITLISANTRQHSPLGTLNIGNDGEGTPISGNYFAALFTRGEKPRTWKEVRVFGFPRKKLNAYDLLYRVLREAVGDRNKEDPPLDETPKLATREGEQATNIYMSGWRDGACGERPKKPTIFLSEYRKGYLNGQRAQIIERGKAVINYGGELPPSFEEDQEGV